VRCVRPSRRRSPKTSRRFPRPWDSPPD
jgi:hypothetical protein